jgi:hypothetical protein
MKKYSILTISILFFSHIALCMDEDTEIDDAGFHTEIDNVSAWALRKMQDIKWNREKMERLSTKSQYNMTNWLTKATDRIIESGLLDKALDRLSLDGGCVEELDELLQKMSSSTRATSNEELMKQTVEVIKGLQDSNCVKYMMLVWLSFEATTVNGGQERLERVKDCMKQYPNFTKIFPLMQGSLGNLKEAIEQEAD